MVKKPPINAGDTGSISGWGRSLAGGHGNSLQYSCLENPMGRGAWWAGVRRVAKNWTGLEQLSARCFLGQDRGELWGGKHQGPER